MHELLRQFAGPWPADERTVARHATYYCDLLAGFADDAPTVRGQVETALVTMELDNIRTAWGHAVALLDINLLSGACRNLSDYYEDRGLFQEGERIFGRAVRALAAGSPPTSEALHRLRAMLLTAHSRFIGWLGDMEGSKMLLHAAMAHLDQVRELDVRPERAEVLMWLGDKYNRSGLRDEAGRYHQQRLDLCREMGDEFGIGSSLCSVGATAWHRGEYALAEAALAESRVHLESFGPTGELSRTYFWIGTLAAYRGDMGTDEEMSRRTIAILEEQGSNVVSLRYCQLPFTLALQGKYWESERLMKEHMADLEEVGWLTELATIRPLLVHTLIHLGRYREAQQEAALSVEECRQAENPWSEARALHYGAAAHLALGNHSQAFADLAESRRLLEMTGNHEMLAVSLAIGVYGAPDGEPVRTAIERALTLILEKRFFTPLLTLLPAIALWRARRGQPVEANALVSFMSRYDYIANSQWFADMALEELLGPQANARYAAVKGSPIAGGEPPDVEELWHLVGSLAGTLSE